MSDSENIQKIKEQLRIKNMELKKKNAQTAKSEEKVRRVFELSRKKISDLKQEIAEKGSPSSYSALNEFHPAIASGSQNDEIPKNITHSGLSDKFLKTANFSPKDQKFVKIIQQLKQENLALTERIKAEQEERRNLIKEKNILLREIKKLHNDPDENQKLKKEISETEIRLKESQRRYEALLEEKRKLVAEYDKILSEMRNAEHKSQVSAEVIERLKNELDTLRIEKENLEVDLREEKQLFEAKLSDKVRKIEEEWEKKVKNLRIRKDRAAHFSEQVMDEPEAPLWMVTYSDMATLLLTFFILYYSIASKNVAMYEHTLMGEAQSNPGLLELADTMKIRTSLSEWSGLKSSDIFADIKNVAKEKSDLDITQNAAKIVVRAPGSALFKPASAILEKEGWPLLDDIVPILKKYARYRVHIQGHTDDYPISTEMFPSNWELSAARATAVLRYFIDKGVDPRRLTATGYADTFPLESNMTDHGRAKNRRVEFVLEKDT